MNYKKYILALACVMPVLVQASDPDFAGFTRDDDLGTKESSVYLIDKHCVKTTFFIIINVVCFIILEEIQTIHFIA